MKKESKTYQVKYENVGVINNTIFQLKNLTYTQKFILQDLISFICTKYNLYYYEDNNTKSYNRTFTTQYLADKYEVSISTITNTLNLFQELNYIKFFVGMMCWDENGNIIPRNERKKKSNYILINLEEITNTLQFSTNIEEEKIILNSKANINWKPNNSKANEEKRNKYLETKNKEISDTLTVEVEQSIQLQEKVEEKALKVPNSGSNRIRLTKEEYIKEFNNLPTEFNFKCKYGSDITAIIREYGSNYIRYITKAELQDMNNNFPESFLIFKKFISKYEMIKISSNDNKLTKSQIFIFNKLLEMHNQYKYNKDGWDFYFSQNSSKNDWSTTRSTIDGTLKKLKELNILNYSKINVKNYTYTGISINNENLNKYLKENGNILSNIKLEKVA